MSDYGITDNGFKRKRLDKLLAELNAECKAIFGDNFNVSPESPDGQINGVVSASNADLWEIAELAYNSFNPSAASGKSLSELVQLNNIERLEETHSVCELTLTGTPGTVVEAGSIFSVDNTQSNFLTDNTVTIGSSGSVVVSSTAEEAGPVKGLAGTIIGIPFPITGLTSVTNLEDSKEGTYEETDPELRARRIRSVSRGAQAVVDAIYAEVSSISGVSKVIVMENDTGATNSDGVPPYSFHVIAIGGDDNTIASAIFIKKGIAFTYGNTSVDVNDSQGFPHTISFTRPTTIPIYVEVDITIYPDYPADGDISIKEAIVDYANGLLIEGRGFSLGDEVIHSRLYTPVNSVQGHEVESIRIGTSPSPSGTDNIPISNTEISEFTVDNIVVNRWN